MQNMVQSQFLNTEELLEIYAKLWEKSWVDRGNNQFAWVVGK